MVVLLNVVGCLCHEARKLFLTLEHDFRSCLDCLVNEPADGIPEPLTLTSLHLLQETLIQWKQVLQNSARLLAVESSPHSHHHDLVLDPVLRGYLVLDEFHGLHPELWSQDGRDVVEEMGARSADSHLEVIDSLLQLVVVLV